MKTQTQTQKEFEEYKELWELDQLSGFFENKEGQLGAMVCGRDPGSVAYFSAV